ncbi:MAG: archease [Gemmatimonadetes bacterium]|nr:archease [Gemmatimonadota bacterium]
MAYRWLPHTADLKVEITSDSLRGVLEETGTIVRELLVGSSEVGTRVSTALTVSGVDAPELLLAVLRALFDLYHRDRLVPSHVELSDPTQGPEGPSVAGRVRGEPFDPRRHDAQPEIKAVTRHALSVRQTGGQWIATVVFDV